MRTCITMFTLVGVLALTTVEAQIPKKEEIPKYLGQLKNSTSARERAEAAAAIGRRGALSVNDVKEALEPLADLVKSDSDAQVRSAAAKALGDIGSQPTLAVPALTEALKDKAMGVKMAAINALGQFGPEARPALPQLRAIAQEKKDKKLSQAANQAVKAISGKKKN